METIKKLFKPHSRNPDRARREFILSILIIASVCLSFIASVISWLYTFSQQTLYRHESLEVTIIFLLFLFGYLLLRRGKFFLVAYSFIFFYIFVTTMSAMRYGADFSQGIITFCLIIAMSGILFNSRFAFIISIFLAVDVTVLIYLQHTGFIQTDASWREQDANIQDGIVLGISFLILAVISWLSNKEIEKALKRAWKSEKALKRERDSLELIVAKRTEELRLAQLEEMSQVYRFVEFGRISAGLFHDLATPLNLVSLNLKSMSEESKTNQKEQLENIQRYLHRATDGTKKLETYLTAARKQLQAHKEKKRFSLTKELHQIIEMLSYKIKQANINVIFAETNPYTISGDPIKCNQIISNLLNNAIDAYPAKESRHTKTIIITLQQSDSSIIMKIKDTGIGISKTQRMKIFEPFYTTKHKKTNLGLGLFITKHILENDFQGEITVASTKQEGTTFVVTFPNNSTSAHEKATN